VLAPMTCWHLPIFLRGAWRGACASVWAGFSRGEPSLATERGTATREARSPLPPTKIWPDSRHSKGPGPYRTSLSRSSRKFSLEAQSTAALLK
jgi:hypothetical protein